jgi:DNA-binding transcriptional MerR regulator
MRIADAADTSGLSQDTIRFYESSGMLPRIARDDRGWRSFSGDDLAWLVVLGHLRATGMPLEDVKRFATSAHSAHSEAEDQRRLRLTLLERHAETLAARRAEIEVCQSYLDRKIATYRTALKGKT